MEKIIFRNLTNVKFQQLKNAISKDKLRPQFRRYFTPRNFTSEKNFNLKRKSTTPTSV